MSAYGFGAQKETDDAKNGVIGRWQYHHSETRDALASAEKASTEYERCCSNSGGREVASVEEKVRSKNIFERELERFRDALEKLENCLTMGYARVIFLMTRISRTLSTRRWVHLLVFVARASLF